MNVNPERARGSHQQMQGQRIYPAPEARNPLRLLPKFYAEAIAKPHPQTFTRASEYARWNLVWLQVLLLVLIPLILSFIKNILRSTTTTVDTHSSIFANFLSVLAVGASIAAIGLKIIFVPVLFFLGVTLQYAIARTLGGRGTYVGHAFSMLIYEVPLSIIGGILLIVVVALHLPSVIFAPIITIALFFLGMFINIAAVQGVHHIQSGKATAAVLIPYILAVIGIAIVVGVLANYILHGGLR